MLLFSLRVLTIIMHSTGLPSQDPWVQNDAAHVDRLYHDRQLRHLLLGLVALLRQQLPALGGWHHLATARRAG